jgi:hypothetical protein
VSGRALGIFPPKYNGACTTSLSSYPTYTCPRKRPSANCLRALLCLGCSTPRASEPDQEPQVDGGPGWRDGSSLISKASAVSPAQARSVTLSGNSSGLLLQLSQPQRRR